LDIAEWENIIAKLRADLAELESGRVEEAEVRVYLNRLLHHAEPLEKNPAMRFFGCGRPEEMPSDARVDFFYRPTCIAAAIFIKALLLYPDIASGGTLSPEPDTYCTEEAMARISACLLGCAGRGFSGAGYDGLKGELETADFFVSVGVMPFLRQYPDLCPEFTNRFLGLLNGLKAEVEDGALFGDWGEDYTDEGRMLLARVGETTPGFLPEYSPVFVYGTLMSGQRAFSALQDAAYIGNAVLKGFAMYDLGSCPGVVPAAGEYVFGEVYSVEKETLRQLDNYEDAGGLYVRTSALVTLNDGSKVNAYFYQYNRPVRSTPVRMRWNMHDDEPVWYACYGSNLSAERFACYIRGGVCAANGREYEGCTDTAMWKADRVKEYPGRMYFAKSSPSWQNGGVSFYMPEDTSSKTVMRLYRITCGQLKEIQNQEGPSASWYGRILYLESIDGVPVFTLTSEETLAQTEPSEEYLALLHDALVFEAGLTEGKAERYLKRCGKKRR